MDYQPRYTYIQGANNGYDPMPFPHSFISSQGYSNLYGGPTIPSYIGNGQITLQNSSDPLYTECSYQSSASGKAKSSSEDEPATDFTSFLEEDEDLHLSDLNFLQDSDKRVAASIGTQNDELNPTLTEQPHKARFSRQLAHNAHAASSDFVQAELGLMISSHTKGKSRICSSSQTTASNSSCHMSPKKVTLRRIWMSCDPRSFPNGRKIRALAQLAEISSKTARKWLKEFAQLGLIPISGQQVEQTHQVACVTRHGRPTSPFQPRNLERKYICTDCHHTFKRKDDWIKHTSLNYLRSYWQCLDCPYRCPAKRSDKLKQHFESKHPQKKLVVDAATHYHDIDGPFEKQCGFCGHICMSFDGFTGHVSRHFEDSTADPPYDMRIWRDPWPSEEAEHSDHSEDDDDDDGGDESDPEDGQDGDGDSKDFDGRDEETNDNQDSWPSGGSGADNFSNYPAADEFDDGSASFDRWVNWRSTQVHKQHRHLASDSAQQDGQNMDSAKVLSTDSREKLWSMTSQTRQGKSGVSVSTPFRILGLNSGLRRIRLDRGPTVAQHDTQGNDVKVRRSSWTSEEDERLLGLLENFGAKNWIRIAEYMPNRSPRQCRQRYHQDLKLEALSETALKLPGSWCGEGGLSPCGMCQKFDLHQICKSPNLERHVRLEMYPATSRYFSSAERGPAKHWPDIRKILGFNEGTTDTATFNNCGLRDTRMDLYRSVKDWADDALTMDTLWLTGTAGGGKSTIAHTIAQTQKDRDRPARSLLMLDGENDKTDKGGCAEVNRDTIYPGHRSLSMQDTTEDVTSPCEGIPADLKDEDEATLIAEKAAKLKITKVGEGSQQSFPSNFSTNPFAHYLNHGSGLSSGSTSELGSSRAVSFLTLSILSSSTNRDFQDFFDDTSPCEHPSSHDADRTLQGISCSNHGTRIDAFGFKFDRNLLYDSGDANGSDFSGVQSEYTSRVSTQIPARLITTSDVNGLDENTST